MSNAGVDGLKSQLSIGDVATAAHISVPAIRYYEREGLLTRPGRTPGGMRRYPPAVLSRLRFIGQAKALGLSLSEIRQLLDVPVGRAGACRQVLLTIDRHLGDVDGKLAALADLRKTLRRLRDACAHAIETEAEPPCPTLKSLESNLLPADVKRAARRRPGVSSH